MGDLGLNPRPRAALHHFGSEQEPLLQIDGVLRTPQALVDYAATGVDFAPAYGAGGGYPGLRAPSPLDYVGAVARAFSPLVIEAFGLGDVRLARAECNFSLVTLPAEALVPSQRVPHIDTVDPLQFAFLHFICGPEFGGTGFYRHRATGYEMITPERLERYDAIRAVEEAAAPAPAAYIADHSPHFERIAAFEPAFDRMLIYRSRVLHSGQVSGAPLSPDPRHGRLTANIFLNYRRA